MLENKHISLIILALFLVIVLFGSRENYKNYSSATNWQRVLQPLNYYLARFFPNYFNADYPYYFYDGNLPQGPWNQPTQFNYNHYYW